MNAVAPAGGQVLLDGEPYYRIADAGAMPEFFMSLVGPGDHWMFVSSCGAVTAGRRDADRALFPYAPDDQISAARATTGATTLIRTGHQVWEPYSTHPAVAAGHRRNLYKTPLGNKLVFEEVNEAGQLSFRYRWAFSQRFGIVRSCELANTSGDAVSLELLDGLGNVLPSGAGREFTMRFSNLANAYKKSELVAGAGLGLFYLSSVPTDRAEPSESLRANTVWHTGFEPGAVLLSDAQMPGFWQGHRPETEHDVRGKPGAFLLHRELDLPPGGALRWQVVAEVGQDHSAVVGLRDWLENTTDPGAEVEADIGETEQAFLRILSSADGAQAGSNPARVARHLSNTVFNVMRGGIPLEGYRVSRSDFLRYVANFNRATLAKHQDLLAGLAEHLSADELRDRCSQTGDPDLRRLGLEYLPLAFSRRHGDPTRPWNHFSIELESGDGRTNLNYQGNWRDIFQNWEALALSFPGFLPAMVSRFVNATTADGYNPYRVTRDGFEWEEPSPDDPWGNIGYWGDHQIIYLLKLLEWSRAFDPAGLDAFLGLRAFTHADVPYRIKSYGEILNDVHNTIEFDAQHSAEIRRRVDELGADGKLLHDRDGRIHYTTLVDKLLVLSLAKLSNFVPDGGIWLNTQRPEWNDANNALVGNGVSMVTACYLHRWCRFLEGWLSTVDAGSFEVASETAALLERVETVLGAHLASLTAGRLDPGERLQIVSLLSEAGSDYRSSLYADGLSGQTSDLPAERCALFFRTARECLAATVRHARRADGLFHSYNILNWRPGGLDVEHLDEMLEGQVAALSSRLLSPEEVVGCLDALRASALYRENQDSYMLYPDRNLPRFLEKNRIDQAALDGNALVRKLLESGDGSVVRRDVLGGVHFNGDFRNSADLRNAIAELGGEFRSEVESSGGELVAVFEDLFGHHRFTGRSGTFFAYEGLGSIYWHMVSKLALAVSENFFWALEAGSGEGTTGALADHYRAVKRGIGAEKTPAQYGAFPSDPYSHTPENAGVKQPGMTGQVKEDIIARFAELGVHIEDGRLGFRPGLFEKAELLDALGELSFFGLGGEARTVSIPAGGFAFTLFQTPVVYQLGEKDMIEITPASGSPRTVEGRRLDAETSRHLFSRSGHITKIECFFSADTA